MNTKQKAQNLVEKFIQTNGNSFFAKQCALIAVDEIIEQIHLLNHDPHYRDLNSYWQEVKKEIELL
jgi:hypothetical protein